MNLADELREVFIDLDKYESDTEGTWDWGVEKCRQKEVELLTADMNETLRYLDNECTADEFAWISEVFDDVAEITQSRRFTEVLRRLAEKYPEETKKYNILSFIESAEAVIGEDEENSEPNGT